MSDDELTPALTQRAARILEEVVDEPLGTEVPFELNGKEYVARLEEHDDPERGPHKGISLFEGGGVVGASSSSELAPK